MKLKLSPKKVTTQLSFRATKEQINAWKQTLSKTDLSMTEMFVMAMNEICERIDKLAEKERTYKS